MFTRRTRSVCLTVALGLTSLAPTVHAQATLTSPHITVDVDASGVLLALPAGDLVTVDGPPTTLTSASDEWLGVSATVAGAPVAVVAGTGDWASRDPVQVVSFQSEPDRVVSVALGGPFRIETVLQFDDDGPYLLGAVTVTNVSAYTARDVLCTREWRTPGASGWTSPSDIPVAPAPADVCRRVWMFDDLPPGGSGGIGFAYRASAPPTEGTPTPDVPLALWTNVDFPNGFVMGDTNGVSWGDYDADGDPDLFVCNSGELWRNENGTTWELAADLDTVLPATSRRYGSSFADYDADGLPDIATEPRFSSSTTGDTCLHLLRNLGGAVFVDVATDPTVVDLQPCDADAETICWGDVDGDGHIDMFVPVYPPWAFAGPGNFFLYNRGPDASTGVYTFTEQSADVGLDNPPGSARPEGAQFLDVDFDGDLDLYSNGTLYQNSTRPQSVVFNALDETISGIGLSTELEEGAAFFDYDMDGDDDLAIAYVSGLHGVRLWENRGDGTFYGADEELIESHTIGLAVGLSYADWDNDGDVDFTTRQVFRRNMLVETGLPGFVLGSNTVPIEDSLSATPAWADWDRDGDVDCALGNWLLQGKFYENVLYDATTPDDERRSLRVRIVRDDGGTPRGLETEFGAAAELRIAGDTSGLRRRQFTSSSAGYLNQNEYALHFGLPADPDPGDPDVDLHLALSVDFPTLAGGDAWRVDGFVNAALGDIDFAGLAEREVTVFRSGLVVVDGVARYPETAGSPLLTTTAGGLALPTPSQPLPAVVPTPFLRNVGIEVDADAGSTLRLRELVVDGQLAAPVTCGPDTFNVSVWNLPSSGPPQRIPGGSLAFTTSPENDRSRFVTDVVLAGGATYRIVARVSSLRPTTIDGPVDQGALTVCGGLNFGAGSSACLAGPVGTAQCDPTRVYLAARVTAVPPDPWVDLGNGKPGTGGLVPTLTGTGSLTIGTAANTSLRQARPLAPAAFVLGFSELGAAFKGGVMVPNPDITIDGLTTGATGGLELPLFIPDIFFSGLTMYFQYWISDTGGTFGLSASNGLSGTVP